MSAGTTQFRAKPDDVHAGDYVYVDVEGREPEWCRVVIPATGGVWVLVPGTDHDVARVDAPAFVVERADAPVPARFQLVHVGHGEHAIVDTADPADGRPYTTCCGHRGSDAEVRAAAERDALNAGTLLPDPIWYGEDEYDGGPYAGSFAGSPPAFDAGPLDR